MAWQALNELVAEPVYSHGGRGGAGSNATPGAAAEPDEAAPADAPDEAVAAIAGAPAKVDAVAKPRTMANGTMKRLMRFKITPRVDDLRQDSAESVSIFLLRDIDRQWIERNLEHPKGCLLSVIAAAGAQLDYASSLVSHFTGDRVNSGNMILVSGEYGGAPAGAGAPCPG
jgi:hypothetical protein